MIRAVFLTIFSFFVFCVSASSQASEKIAVNGISPNNSCQFQDSASLNLSFNGMVDDPTKATGLIESKTAELEALAKEKGATKFELQNKNLSLNPMGDGLNGGGYNYNANYSFVVEPSAAAIATLQVAGAKGLRIGLNMNSYRQCR